MKICLLALLTICSCGNRLSDTALINLIQSDLIMKERMVKEYSIYLQAYTDKHPDRLRPLNFYLIQRNLLRHYDSLGMNISNHAAIDSIDFAFIKSYKYGVDDPETLNSEIISDSLSFYHLKSSYLNKIINLQWQLFSKLPNEKCGFETRNNDVMFNLLSSRYHASDTLKAIISPVYHHFDYIIKTCSIVKNGKIVAKPEIISNHLQYGPLKKGTYTINIILQKVKESYFNDPSIVDRSFDFVVE